MDFFLRAVMVVPHIMANSCFLHFNLLSVQSAATFCNWKDAHINIIDSELSVFDKKQQICTVSFSLLTLIEFL